MNKQSARAIGIGALVLLLGIGAGAAIDHFRAKKEMPLASHEIAMMQHPKPPLPQSGELLASSDNAEITGTAYCGHCYWGVGEAPDNVVLKTESVPGIIFLSPNEKVSEIEKVTGKCAGGNIVIKARGILSRHDDHNYLYVREFEKVAAK